MGDIANIHVFEGEERTGIYFYTHWTGHRLPNILRKALERGKERWDDPPYLSRIIFSEMIKDEVLDLTGYGISQYICDNDGYPIIEVNLTENTVEIDTRKYTFEEFTTSNNIGW